MLIGWINVYELPDILSIIFWGLAGLTALFLLGYLATSIFTEPMPATEADKQMAPAFVRVLPEGNRWEEFTRNPSTIREISEIAIRVATTPVVPWDLIYPHVQTQEARDVVRNCGKVYLYQATLTDPFPGGA